MSKPKRPAVPEGVGRTFDDLLRSIRGIDAELAAQAGRAVNVSLTLPNWLIGCYIAEYELSGAERARYGAHSSNGGGPRVLGTQVRIGP
jgi:hypothetical protein